MGKNKGFTLLELMVGMAILAILTAVSVPNAGAWLANHRLSSSARDVYSMIQLSRLRAVKEQSDVVININSSSGSYISFVDNGAGGGTINDGSQSGTEPTVLSGQFEGDISLVSVTSSDFRFDSRGFPKKIGSNAFGGTTVSIKNGQNQQKSVILSFAGHVRIAQ